ncbi:MAG: hypothetical protein EAZ95_17335 [Bacteroidetes bacterium]|nr:MAG: hypothetical protein EAZ95_17335 [Bacteroidota bacterium]
MLFINTLPILACKNNQKKWVKIKSANESWYTTNKQWIRVLKWVKEFFSLQICIICRLYIFEI